jgi:hypothetical protein
MYSWCLISKIFNICLLFLLTVLCDFTISIIIIHFNLKTEEVIVL